jgi:hypothetical protein
MNRVNCIASRKRAHWGLQPARDYSLAWRHLSPKNSAYQTGWALLTVFQWAACPKASLGGLARHFQCYCSIAEGQYQSPQAQQDNQTHQPINSRIADEGVRHHRGCAFKLPGQPAARFARRCKPTRNPHQNVVNEGGGDYSPATPSDCDVKRVFRLLAHTANAASVVPCRYRKLAKKPTRCWLTQEQLAEISDLHLRTAQKIAAGEINLLLTIGLHLKRALTCP